MLQIMIASDEVDKLVYHSLPYGVPVKKTTSVKRWLQAPATKQEPEELDGQVRILFRPEVFTDHSRGRILHYSGDWEVHGGSADLKDSRAAFVLALRKVLSPVLHRGTLCR